MQLVLKNLGWDTFVRSILPSVAEIGVPIIANAAGGTEEDYVEVVQKIQVPGIAGVELNISCPNVTDIVQMALAVEGAGADAISMINALISMGINVERRRPLIGNVIIGLSGPAVKPVAVRRFGRWLRKSRYRLSAWGDQLRK